MVATSKRVPVNGTGDQEGVRVVSIRLSGRAAIEVPDRQVCKQTIIETGFLPDCGEGYEDSNHYMYACMVVHL